MKKIVPIFIVGVLVLSGLGAVAVSENEQKILAEDTILISEPILKETQDYITIHLNEATSLSLAEGKPILPVVTRVYTFPLGTKFENVDVTFSEINEQVISKKIEPAPEPVPLVSNDVVNKKITKSVIDNEIYSSSNLYPMKQYSVKMGVGLKDNEHVIFVRVRCYPVQYSPVKDTIYVSSNIDIDITYKEPINPVVFGDAYDMVIITTEEFASQLQPLVDHKNDNGIETTVKTVEEIYSEYSGRDEPEEIKLFIKDAIEDWGIQYVFLFGGRKGQSLDWNVPDRRTNNDDGWEGGYSSDLYYSDVLKWNNDTQEWEFEDWDSDGDGKFAEWTNFAGGKDIMDLYPDVYVGRIDCRYSSQVETVIDKIITYETSADPSWFEKGLVISGDTSPPARGNVKLGVYEGELSTGITADLLEDIGFDVDRLWTSMGTFTGPKDVQDAINDGAGFIHFAGHGNPAYWGNFEPDAETEAGMIDGLQLKDMWRLKNGEKLPFVVVGGCHNAQINTSMANIVEGIKKYGFKSYFFGPSYRFFYKEWVPACWASWLVLKKNGGSIGTIGNTGLGYGWINEYCTQGLGGWINPRFFDAYVNQGKNVLGEAWGQAVTDYINIIMDDDHQPKDPQIDRKTIEEWILIGDPSLNLGGI